VSDAGKFQGIYPLDSNPSSAILLDDMAYYVRLIPTEAAPGLSSILKIQTHFQVPSQCASMPRVNGS
jgi:hypothetical protein